MSRKSPHFVGLGGTLRPGSSSETAVRLVLGHLDSMGATIEMFGGAQLDIPTYNPGGIRSPEAMRIIDALRRADGVILGSPGYHGSISGMLKNVLDYTEDMRTDPQVYLEGRVVGCIACVAGPQAIGTTLTAMRSIVHALRGWPTPLGVGINTAVGGTGPNPWLDGQVQDALRMLAGQAMSFTGHKPATVSLLREDVALAPARAVAG